MVRVLSALALGIVGLACYAALTDPRPVDFLSFWAAGQLGADAYNLALHKSVEETVVKFVGSQPFLNPPPFLFIVSPFAMLPYGLAFVAWVGLTGSLFFAATRRLDFPPVVATGLVGQSAFLNTALFAFGVSQIQRRPILAGCLIGCLVIKPQIAVLLPIALIAGGYWKTLASAALSSCVLCLAALLAFGWRAYAGFLATVGHHSEFIAMGVWPWWKMASPYAFCRAIGLTDGMAWIVHGLIAAAACFVVWRSWKTDDEAKIAILAGSSVLISPYLFTYDALLLVIPFVTLLRTNVRAAWCVWLLCLLPVLAIFGLYAGPNATPVAAIIAILALLFRNYARPAPEPSLTNP